jgi:hypothetical protein
VAVDRVAVAHGLCGRVVVGHVEREAVRVRRARAAGLGSMGGLVMDVWVSKGYPAAPWVLRWYARGEPPTGGDNGLFCRGCGSLNGFACFGVPRASRGASAARSAESAGSAGTLCARSVRTRLRAADAVHKVVLNHAGFDAQGGGARVVGSGGGAARVVGRCVVVAVARGRRAGVGLVGVWAAPGAGFGVDRHG